MLRAPAVLAAEGAWRLAERMGFIAASQLTDSGRTVAGFADLDTADLRKALAPRIASGVESALIGQDGTPIVSILRQAANRLTATMNLWARECPGLVPAEVGRLSTGRASTLGARAFWFGTSRSTAMLPCTNSARQIRTRLPGQTRRATSNGSLNSIWSTPTLESERRCRSGRNTRWPVCLGIAGCFGSAHRRREHSFYAGGRERRQHSTRLRTKYLRWRSN